MSSHPQAPKPRDPDATPDRESLEAIVDEHRDVFETIANADELPEDFRQRYGVNILHAGGQQ